MQEMPPQPGELPAVADKGVQIAAETCDPAGHGVTREICDGEAVEDGDEGPHRRAQHLIERRAGHSLRVPCFFGQRRLHQPQHLADDDRVGQGARLMPPARPRVHSR